MTSITTAPSSGEVPSLAVDAFVRSVALNRDIRHSLFLGAGASVTSGIPSADACIWQWKRDFFLTRNPGLEQQFDDASLPSVRDRIQRWLDTMGTYPAMGDPDEYGFYAELAYPIADDRRQYFQRLAEHATPFIGYQLLCLLAEAGVFGSVWTTNFDGLVPRAAATLPITVVEVGLGTPGRMFRVPRSSELLHVAVHGDYRYDSLKNTPAELRTQDADLRKTLVDSLKSTNLIVCGYSGRDQSIMDAFQEAYSQRGTGRLFWCGRQGETPAAAVLGLLRTARTSGREAFFVPTDGFDDLMGRLALHCLTGDRRTRAESLRSELLTVLESPPFRTESGCVRSLIKSNAFPIELPCEVLQFDAPAYRGEAAWARLRERTANQPVLAAPLGGKILAVGTVDGVQQAFRGEIEGEIHRIPMEKRDVARPDGVVSSLLTEALARSLSAQANLNTNRDLLWKTETREHRVILEVKYDVHDAALLALRSYGGRSYLIVKPTIVAFGPNRQDAQPDIDKELKRLILTGQYNKQFNDAVNAWRKWLFGTATTFEYPPNLASAFRFVVDSNPAFALVTDGRARHGIVVPPAVQRSSAFQGMQRVEPALVFSDSGGRSTVTDPHPLRGLSQNKPYDFALTRNAFSSQVRLGVVCPREDTSRLASYLNRLHMSAQPTSKAPYLLEYPGFAQALGLPLNIPRPTEPGWTECPEPRGNTDTCQGAQELGRRLTSSIEALCASANPSVVLVYIPTRWQAWENYEHDMETFDLHDYVKAFCVQRGIATQFLREATLTKQHQCEVRWWLALSFYVKSLRTPWVLDNLDRQTAFLGLGFSIDRSAPHGQRVIQGCSHIYSSDGLGLRYRLSKLESSEMRHGNPFMSRDDARRMGENVRQLFYDSMGTLPRRVVVHKRTPYRREEREGLLEGLHGVTVVDMLEINVEDMVRYVASTSAPDGTYRGDPFPVQRGTALVLDPRRALLWVHGASQAVNPTTRYYLGKSRIPAPLMLIRHHGTSSLATLADEVLGLSKMNWNSFDLYSRVPATIQSSNKIAEIGALLERGAPQSFDYRLFI